MINDKIEKNSINHKDDKNTLQALFEISEAIAFTGTLEELSRAIHKAIGKIFNHKNINLLLLYKENNDTLTPLYADKNTRALENLFNLKETTLLSCQVMEKKKPLIFFKKEIAALLKSHKTQNLEKLSEIWMGAPLLIRQKAIGIIAIRSLDRSADCQKKDLKFLKTISSHIALALERKKSNEELTSQRQILQTILDSSPVGIALVQNRVFKKVNNEMVSLLGYPSKQALENQSVRNFYRSEKDYDLAGKMIYYGLASNGKAEYEIDLIRRDGTRFPAHIWLNGEDKRNPMAWTIAIVTDLSLRKAADKIKEEKEKLQGALETAEAICHEITTPLQNIIQYTNLLADKKKLSEQNIKNLKSEVLKVGKITQRLTKITRYKVKKSSNDVQMVDIWGASNES